jgi:hypothetical protein
MKSTKLAQQKGVDLVSKILKKSWIRAKFALFYKFSLIHIWLIFSKIIKQIDFLPPVSLKYTLFGHFFAQGKYTNGDVTLQLKILNMDCQSCWL